MKYTLAPWEHNGQGLIYGTVFDGQEEAPLVADCGDMDGDFGSSEMKANANLIAAAPKLLHEMQDALYRIRAGLSPDCASMALAVRNALGEE